MPGTTDTPDATLMADHSFVVGHSCLRCGAGEEAPHGTHSPLERVTEENARETASRAEYRARAYEIREERKRAARGGSRGLLRALRAA